MTMQSDMPRHRSATTIRANELSYVIGDVTSPASELTVPGLLAETVKLHGQRPAAVFREQGIRGSWQELAEAVDAMSAGLHALGLRSGERVGIWSPSVSSGC